MPFGCCCASKVDFFFWKGAFVIARTEEVEGFGAVWWGFPNGFVVEGTGVVFAGGFGNAPAAKGLLGDGTLEVAAEPAALPKVDV